MSAADAARRRADRLRKELRADAIRLQQELTRLIRDMSEEGTFLGTRAVAQQAADLDRDARYLTGLEDGLERSAEGPAGHKHVFLGDDADLDRMCITSMDCGVTWREVYSPAPHVHVFESAGPPDRQCLSGSCVLTYQIYLLSGGGA